MSADVYWQEMLARCDTKSWVLEVRGCAWAELRVTGESLVIVHGLQAITALTLAHEAATSLPALIAELRAARAVVAAAKELNERREKNYYFEWNELEDRCSEYDRAAKGAKR